MLVVINYLPIDQCNLSSVTQKGPECPESLIPRIIILMILGGNSLINMNY